MSFDVGLGICRGYVPVKYDVAIAVFLLLLSYIGLSAPAQIETSVSALLGTQAGFV